MAQNERMQFSASLLFIVTAVSFFIFGVVVNLIDGSVTHSTLFFKIAIAALVLGGVSLIIKSSLKKKNGFPHSRLNRINR